MRQLSLKFNTYVRSVSLINNNLEKLIFKIILCSFSALTLSYIILLGTMVKNIVERQGLEVRARALTNEVRDLEVAYLSKSNNIDLSFSYSLGFKETQAIFTNRGDIGMNSSGASLGNKKAIQNDL